jgi:hypothetical protein
MQLLSAPHRQFWLGAVMCRFSSQILIKMNLENEVKIVFKNDEGKTKEITVTVKQLLENTTDDFYEWLDDTEPCTSASCNNESQNFCDCGSSFEDYEISEVLF